MSRNLSGQASGRKASGGKIQNLTHLKILFQELIAQREREADAASALLAGLSINGERVSSVEEMEWKYGSSGLTRDRILTSLTMIKAL